MKNLKSDEILKVNTKGQLLFLQNGKEIPVFAKSCFPWLSPWEQVSFRNSDGDEVYFLEKLEGLDTSLKNAILNDLNQAGFVLQITEVQNIKEEFELRVWNVMTSSGERRFQTSIEEWPHPYNGNGLIIKDLSGDLYIIESTNTLTYESLKYIRPFID